MAAVLDFWLLVIAVVMCIAVVLFVNAVALDRPVYASSSAVSGAPEHLPGYWVERVTARVLPSVVTLQHSEADGAVVGSGIILSADGLILTNNHVVAARGADPHPPARIQLILNDGRTAPVQVIAADAESDVAVVRAQGISGLKPIALGSSAHLRVGQPVAAVGSPLGLGGTVTTGIISALNRLVCPVTDRGRSSAYYAVQTDAAINPGNSGGALVDMNGELVGINAAEAVIDSADDPNSQHGSIGLGFAIPIDHAARIANELIATGRATHAWLGAQVGGDSDPHGDPDGDPDGAKIIAVESDGPAAAAGLTAGAIITKVGDQPIGSGQTLLAAVQSREPGDSVTVVFTDSSGDSRSVQVKLGTDRSLQ